MSRLLSLCRTRRKLAKLAMGAAGFLIVLLLAGVLLCRFLGIRSREDLVAYHWMRADHYHPVWKDLALRRIRKGDDLEEMIRKHPPIRREDFGPYTALLYHKERVAYNTLQIIATDGVLIDARAASCCWEHIFFESPAHEQAFNQAYSAYLRQMGLEGYAWHIHRAITTGQDVFLAGRIERREITKNRELQFSSAEERRQYEDIYGRDYAKLMGGPRTIPELTVEVAQVLYGNLKPGMTLTFPGEECEHAMKTEPQVIFLRFDDSRTIFPHTQGGELYHAVPRRALDWYQSLTQEQFKEFEARALARQRDAL
ncbi:MAG: hypothetical protein ABFE13_27495 [Phycisphaerales bacterium]